jgi:hypothetical protein
VQIGHDPRNDRSRSPEYAGTAKPDKSGSRGLLNDQAVDDMAGKVGDGLMSAGQMLVSNNHGSWQVLGMGEANGISDHYQRNQDARLKQQTIRAVLDAKKQGEFTEADLVDLVNNLTDHDAEKSQDVLAFIASEIAGGNLDVGFYSADGTHAGMRDAEAFVNNLARMAGLNVDELNLRDSRAVMSAVAEEGYHAREEGSDAYANLYGDRFGYLWDRSNRQDGRQTGGQTSLVDWKGNNAGLLAANDEQYRQYGLGDLEFRQMHDKEIEVLKNSPLVDKLMESKGIERNEALTLLARNLAWRIDDDWASEEHILQAHDYEAQKILDELAAEGHADSNGRPLFQREYNVNPDVYENNLIYAGGLNEQFFYDPRSIFYVNHVVSDQVNQDLYGFQGGLAYQSRLAGIGDYHDGVLSGLKDQALWVMNNPMDFSAGLAKELAIMMSPLNLLREPEKYRQLKQSYSNWSTADERAALAYFHGAYTESGQIKTEDTWTNIGLATSITPIGGMRKIGADGLDDMVSSSMRYSDGDFNDFPLFEVDTSGMPVEFIVPNKTLNHQASSGVLLQAESGKTTTILGSYNKDMASIVDELGNVKSMDFGSKSGGFNVLNAPDELFTTLGPKGFWDEVNVPFLNTATSRGDNILMATKPAFDVVDNRGMGVLIRPNTTTGKMELTGFGKEYLTLRRQGYIYQNGKIVKP